MRQNAQFGHKAEAVVERANTLEELKLLIGGTFTIEHLDKDGKVLGTYKAKNAAANEGLNHILDVAFRNQTPTAQWYCGLVDVAGFSAFNVTDTAAQINGSNSWDEEDSYSGGNRIAWSPGAASSQQLTNASAMVFSMTGTASIKGIFIASAQAQNATTGKLWATATFSANVSVSNGDQLRVTYTLSAA